jgi:hypothetical protein
VLHCGAVGGILITFLASFISSSVLRIEGLDCGGRCAFAHPVSLVVHPEGVYAPAWLDSIWQGEEGKKDGIWQDTTGG